jgi:hypothetical protein
MKCVHLNIHGIGIEGRRRQILPQQQRHTQQCLWNAQESYLPARGADLAGHLVETLTLIGARDVQATTIAKQRRFENPAGGRLKNARLARVKARISRPP